MHGRNRPTIINLVNIVTGRVNKVQSKSEIRFAVIYILLQWTLHTFEFLKKLGVLEQKCVIALHFTHHTAAELWTRKHRNITNKWRMGVVLLRRQATNSWICLKPGVRTQADYSGRCIATMGRPVRCIKHCTTRPTCALLIKRIRKRTSEIYAPILFAKNANTLRFFFLKKVQIQQTLYQRLKHTWNVLIRCS